MTPGITIFYDNTVNLLTSALKTLPLLCLIREGLFEETLRRKLWKIPLIYT